MLSRADISPILEVMSKLEVQPEVLILQNNPGKRSSLNFQNYVKLNINKGLEKNISIRFSCLWNLLLEVQEAKYQQMKPLQMCARAG